MTFAPQNPYHFSHLLSFTFSTPSTVPVKGSFDFLSKRDRCRWSMAKALYRCLFFAFKFSVSSVHYSTGNFYYQLCFQLLVFNELQGIIVYTLQSIAL
nr:hypothetical protein CFP56_39245 [Quercus suber]